MKKISKNVWIIGAIVVALLLVVMSPPKTTYAIGDDYSVEMKMASNPLEQINMAFGGAPLAVYTDADSGNKVPGDSVRFSWGGALPCGPNKPYSQLRIYVSITSPSGVVVRNQPVTTTGGLQVAGSPYSTPASCDVSTLFSVVHNTDASWGQGTYQYTVRMGGGYPVGSGSSVDNLLSESGSFSLGTPPVACSAAVCTAKNYCTGWADVGCVNGQMKQYRECYAYYCSSPSATSCSNTPSQGFKFISSSSCVTTTPTPCTSTCSTLGATRCVSGSPTKIEICQTSGTCKVWNAVTCDGGTTCQPTNPPNCGTGTPTTSPPPPGTETCSDGIKNQGELKTDCGGPCPACQNGETCSDGVQNQGEFGIDCGGPCQACPPPEETCSDNLMNQGETGIDCGGPCADCAGCTTVTDCTAKSITCKDGSAWSYTPACSSGTCAYSGEPPAACTGVETCKNPWENPQNNCQPNWLWITLGAVVAILLIALGFKTLGKKPPVSGFMPY